MISILQQKGYQLKVDKIEGGNHTWEVWRPQLPTIFNYFYGLKSSN